MHVEDERDAVGFSNEIVTVSQKKVSRQLSSEHHNILSEDTKKIIFDKIKAKKRNTELKMQKMSAPEQEGHLSFATVSIYTRITVYNSSKSVHPMANSPLFIRDFVNIVIYLLSHLPIKNMFSHYAWYGW